MPREGRDVCRLRMKHKTIHQKENDGRGTKQKRQSARIVKYDKSVGEKRFDQKRGQSYSGVLVWWRVSVFGSPSIPFLVMKRRKGGGSV